MIERTLGNYEVLDKLGEGGMGEVYKARDTKLGRDVAIKVLPELLSKDEERLARFGREARVLASLNHANIAAIYGLEESDGVQFIVLELVDGETLSDRIARGPIPVDEALPLFKQIAEALEAAHEKGIIHRDIKPANVKITPQGKVKVLDFGLAKALGDESAEGDQSESPTATYGATRAGIIMGTASYMSPEQTRGKSLDKRTDIWSFGCVLYEALTGKKAFEGETITDTIASIVRNEPNWNNLPLGTPSKIRELLTRCLRKEPARRLHDMGDVRLDIEDAAGANELTAEPTGMTGESRTRIWAIFLAGIVISSVATVLVIGYLEQPESRAIRRLAIPLPETDVLVHNRAAGIALSPDGTNLVYVAQRGDTAQLYSRRLDQLTPRPLVGSEGANGPFFSPDGQWIGFWAGGQIKKMPIAGGPSTTVCDVADLWGAFWAADDRIYFSSSLNSEILRVAASGGSPEKVTTLESKRGETSHLWPTVLPSGEAMLFCIWRGGDNWALAVLSLDTGERKILLPESSNARYTSTGHLIFAKAGSLLAAPLDLARLEITGTPIPVLDNVFVDDRFEADFDFSNDGTLVYVPSSNVTRLSTLVWVDRQGVERPVTEIQRPYAPQPRLSPDGKRLAVSIMNAAIGWDIWVLELERGTLTRLTFGGMNLRPMWSHDSTRVIFTGSSHRTGGAFQIFSVPSDGSGEAQQLTEGAYRGATSVSPDGNLLFFRQWSDDGSNWDIGVLRLEGGGEPEVLVGSPFNERMGMISPDGLWLAYTSDESGREEIYVRPFPGPGGRVLVSTDGGTEPLWARDGQELFYREGDRMMAVPINAGQEFNPGTPVILFKGDYQTGIIGQGTSTNYDIAPDGRSFIMIRPEGASAPNQLNVVLNWFEELKRLAPRD
jgi:serine/threonine-protein kinase